MKNKIQLSLFLTLLIIGMLGKFATVAANPVVDFTYSGICVGSPTGFNADNTFPATGIVETWDWDFGDGTYSNSKNPLHLFAASGDFPVTLTISYDAVTVGSVTKLITIKKLPIPNFSFSTPNCNNDSIQFTDLTGTAGGSIISRTWHFGDGSPDVTIVPPGDPNTKHIFPNTGTFPVTLTVMNVDSCVNTFTLNVTISARPVADFNFSGKCEDQEVTFTDASIANSGGGIIERNWDFRDPVSGIFNSSLVPDPSHVFQNAGTYLVKLTIKNYNNCIDTVSKNVLINPHPAVDFTASTTCLNNLATFSPDPLITNIPSIAEWHWDFADGYTPNTQNAAHTFLAVGNYPVTLTVKDTKGCINVASNLLVVDPLPVAHFNAAVSACAGTAVQFQNQSIATPGYYIAQWYWDFGDGISKTVNHPDIPNVSHVYASPNNYNVKLTITGSNGCSNSETQLIKILPNPVADFNFTPACLGTTVNFNDLTITNLAGAITDWKWNFNDSGSGVLNNSTIQNAQHSFVSIGNHAVQLAVKSANGCADTITHIILVASPPPVDFSTTNNCQNNTMNFDPDLSMMNPVIISSWFWELGNGVTSGSSNPTHVYTSAGTHNVKLTIVDNVGCTNTITKSVTIIPQPTVIFSYTSPVCKQSTIQFKNLTDATPGIVVRSEWNFGDGQIQTVAALTPVSHSYSTNGTYNVTLTVITSDSCRKFKTLPVIVLPDPLANFSFLTSCINTPVQFKDLSQPSSGAIASWSWDFGDAASGTNNAATIKNPAHTYDAAGIFQVTLIVANTGGCIDTIIKPLKVRALPDVDFTFSAGCVNNSTQFVSSSFVNTAALASCQWNFGDGFTSADVDPFHIYSSSGSFTVNLTITDTAGCSSSKTLAVVIMELPVSSFQVSPQTCSKNPVFFTDHSSSATGTLTSFFLEFGDGKDTLINGAAFGTISHVYAKGRKYTAYLTVKNSLGCIAKSSRSINISADPLAEFSYDNTCENTFVNFYDQSQTNSGSSIVSWFWNFGELSSGIDNTSVQKNPFHAYSTPGTYNVILTVENASGCSDIISGTVVIKSKPAVDFSWDMACLGSSTAFTIDPAITNIAAISSFDWDFGDGTVHNTTQKNPGHTYVTTGNFTVGLTVTNTNGCKNTILHTISILPKPTALFSFAGVCAGTSAEFADQSISPGVTSVVSRHWDFGVPAAINDTSDQQNPVWLYLAKGIYTVKLTVTSQNGCKDMASRSVQVFGNPTADFGYIASACENGVVDFRNTSLSQQATIVSSKWEFESDNYSPLLNPSYTFYSTDSCYNVSLIVKDIRGCIDTIVKEVCVPAEFDFTFAESATCIRDSTHFTPQLLAHVAGPLVIFKWNFGDEASGVNNTSTKKIPSHYYSQTGTYTVSLEATDLNNCTKTIYKNITINPLPVASFTYIGGICDSTIYFNESSTGSGTNISKWIWDFGDGVSSIVNAPDSPDVSHLYRSPGSYNVILTVFNANGCSNSYIENTILVDPCVDASIELVDTKICQNNIVAFRNNSFSSVTSNIWYWDFGDGTHATYDMFSNQVNHVYKTPGAFMVRLILSAYVNGRKVNDTAHVVVNVNPSPFPDFTFSVVCNEKKALFTNMTSGSGIKIENYKWIFGEPVSVTHDTSTLKNPVHSYFAPGTYEVTLIAQNVIGCKDSIHKLLVISGLPVANFKSQLSCAGAKTLFSDLSMDGGTPITKWNWTFKDNMNVVGGKDVQNPEFVFKKSGEYIASLKITDANGCHDSTSQYISNWDVPVSDFKLVENYDNVQGQVQLNNISADATRYHWTFGNGDDSYAEKPVQLYPEEGEYKISLIAYNEKGCSDTLSMSYDFMVKSLYVPTAFSPQNPNKEVQLLKPVGINLQSYLFEIYDRWGNLLWWTDKLDSEGRPTEGWNGTFKDTLLPEGAYPWRATGIFKDGSIWQGENVGNNDHLPSSKVGTSTMMR